MKADCWLQQAQSIAHDSKLKLDAAISERRPKLHNVIDDGRSVHIVMEYVPVCLADVTPPADDVSAAIVAGLVDALAFCHRHYVVHRDIKNANALLCDDGVTAKLCDFGFATEWRAADGDATLSSRLLTRLVP